MSDQLGQVVKCAHCNGKGSCYCRICAPFNNKDTRYRSKGDPGICTSCKGSGSVWVGPQVTYVRNHVRDKDIV